MNLGARLRSERVLLETESDVVVPLLILSDRRSKKAKTRGDWARSGR